MQRVLHPAVHGGARLGLRLRRRLGALGQVLGLGDLIVSEHSGKPYRSDHFKRVFARLRASAAAGLQPGDPVLADELRRVCFLHLRQTAVTRLAEASATGLEISGVTGHIPGSFKKILRR